MRNILLIDDEPLVIITLNSLIEWEKYDFKIIMSFSNGEEALNYIINHPSTVDIIISDVDMPKLNGIELGKQLRRRSIDVPIIFLSSYSNFEYVREAFHNGACEYLLKNEIDSQKIINLLTSKKIMKENNSAESKYTVEDDRKSYIYNILNDIVDLNLTFEKCNFKTKYPFSLLFIKIFDITKVKKNLEIQTILEQENLDIFTIDWQHYVILIPDNYNLDKTIKHINTNMWNYMNIIFDYKIINSIKDEKELKFNIKNIFDSFKYYSRLVTVTRKYISENYKDFNLNLTRIADKVSVSNCHLSKEYSKETNETVVEYISKIRIKEAKIFLEESNFKIYEIAELVGFANSETFYRTFKKVTGITPKQFRKK